MAFAVQVSGLGKAYRRYLSKWGRAAEWLGFGVQHDLHWVLQDINLEVRKGESVGVLGRNGAGKSTLLKLIAGTITATRGSVVVNGTTDALLELGMGFDPEATGRQNIEMAARARGISGPALEKLNEEVVAFAAVGDYISQPLRTYSSGMQMRLAFAVSAASMPDVLIVDEALAVGDAAFQRKCFARIERFRAEGGTVLYVSHDIESVRRLCNRAIWIDDGRLMADGSVKEVCDEYERHLFGAVGRTPQLIEFQPEELAPGFLEPDLENTPENAYGDGRATIVERWLEDEAGRRVNVLARSQRIAWCFRVHFASDVPECIFAMRIKTTDGIGVFGSHQRIARDILAGDNVVARFRLTNRLAPGTYFLNCSVLQAGETLNFLHRRVDTYALRVATPAGQVFEGLVDMEPDFALETSASESS